MTTHKTTPTKAIDRDTLLPQLRLYAGLTGLPPEAVSVIDGTTGAITYPLVEGAAQDHPDPE